MKIMASSPISSQHPVHLFMAKRWKTVETVTDLIFLDSQITADGDCSHKIKKTLDPWKNYDKPR